MIDASTSMRTPFKAATPQPARRNRRDVLHDRRRRRALRPAAHEGQVSRPASALVEFGNEAYVVTPFTNDYDNILLSISLIGDPVEYSLFPGSGHDHRAGDRPERRAVQGVQLSRRVRQPDGDLHRRRGHARHRQRTNARRDRAGGGRREDSGLPGAHQLRARARARSFPTSCGFRRSQKTGGKFYAADSEEQPARTPSRTSTRCRPARFRRRSTAASSRGSRCSRSSRRVCWTGAATLKLTVPQFQKLP